MRKRIQEDDLNQFSKQELVSCILHSQELFEPMAILRQKRLDDNLQKIDAAVEENRKIVERMQNKPTLDEYIRLSAILHKNHNRIERLFSDSDRLNEKKRFY